MNTIASEVKTTEKKSVFDDFTGKYALSKTLRFELKPIGKTLENMRTQFEYDEDLRTFMKDQNIEDSYQALKPVLDTIHEEFINESLESESVKNIDFSSYLNLYARKSDVKENDLKLEEKKLRSAFDVAYAEVAELWKNTAGETEKGKGIFGEKSFKILTEAGILEYIRKNASRFSDILSVEEIQKCLKTFEGFFTYFSGFSQNRENYYTTKNEKATAVATRIVHDNLPTFCDNILVFQGKHAEYEKIFVFLRELGDPLVMKNKEKKEVACVPLDIELFRIEHFNECLSQAGIDRYNEAIGNANFLINRYNQVQGEKGAKLKFFKTLYKQIGCGKRDALFFELTDEKRVDADKKRAEQPKKKFSSLEELFSAASEAGKKYFRASGGDTSDISIASSGSLMDLVAYIRSQENFAGFYWSKSAMNTISNRYFSDWHSLKDRLKTAKVFQNSEKGSDEDVKIPEAIELNKLFSVLDTKPETIEGDWKWRDGDVFFRESLTEKIECRQENKREFEQCEWRRKKNERYASIVQSAHSPSRALLEMILSDIEEHAKLFVDGTENIAHLSEYRSDASKDAIKSWLDEMLSATQMIRYFVVRPGKIKGASFDAVLAEYLKGLLDSEKDETNWFRYYDATRNFLTKKPQDDAKKNKLKLNFENGSLLGGWSDGQEKNKASVILRKGAVYYLGILVKKNIFDTEKEDNEMYEKTSSETGRLILANLKFQTLAGKGFLGKFGRAYGEMSKENPKEAIENLQEIMRERYVKKHPLLERIANSEYADKKSFDDDIRETLKECYICEFRSIDWSHVEKYVESGSMHLFQIYTKDFSDKSFGRKNLQTLYWQTVFTEKNAIQLNGGGEIFYRKQAIDELKIKEGYTQKPWVVENKRFSLEGGKFSFHCPIKINYKAKNYSQPKYAISEINTSLNDGIIKNNKKIRFLGIDRGEKHLAYWSLVDEKGTLLNQGSFNTIDGKDYNELLEARAGDRDFARKNWQTIGTIKELKDGYISQVVRKIVDIAIANDAFIVLENLNVGFKRGRQKIEKQVYQKLELALAKKLNFIVDKSAKIGEVGSVTKALQLTPPVNNFSDIDKKSQFGIMFYTRANYTSQTDPFTGWRKTVYLKRGSEETIKKEILKTFSKIAFDGKDYAFTYTEKIPMKTEKGKGKKYEGETRDGETWTLYSGKNGVSLDRFRGKRGTDKNEWKVEKENIVEMLDALFVNFDKTQSLLDQMREGKELVKISSHPAYESLRYIIDLIQQIRNTGKKNDERNSDFLVSPVRNEETGEHFDSRIFFDQEKRGQKVSLPSSGDSNGAYNIARKGILMAEHVKLGYKLYISDEEWSIWLEDKERWRAWLQENEKDLEWEKKKEEK